MHTSVSLLNYLITKFRFYYGNVHFLSSNIFHLISQGKLDMLFQKLSLPLPLNFVLGFFAKGSILMFVIVFSMLLPTLEVHWPDIERITKKAATSSAKHKLAGFYEPVTKQLVSY